MIGSFLILSVVGVLLPFAWPRHRINLFNLLAVIGGMSLAVFVGAWAYRNFGVVTGVAGIVVANWCLVLAWVGIVFSATAWREPSSNGPMA